jgi:RND family efflux transporter MFP subunit
MLVLPGCDDGEEQVKKETVVKTKVVALQGVHPVLNLSGEISASSQHELSFLVPGKISDILVKEGDEIKEGQHLAKLNPIDYDQALSIAKSKLDEANDQYDRLSNMYASGSLPEADYEKIKSLKAEAQANYRLYENKRSYTEIKSPIDGIVQRVWARKGAGVEQGQPVISVINAESVYAKVGIPEKSIYLVDLNDSCTIEIPAIRDTVYGEIYKISPSASRLTRTYEASIAIINQDLKLKDGMLCNVQVKEHATDSVIQVPVSIIKSDPNGLKYVFVNREGIAKKQRVIPERIMGNNAILANGLNPGDALILNPPIDILDGTPIKVE